MAKADPGSHAHAHLTLPEALNRAVSLIQMLDEQISTIEYTRDRRRDFAIGCFETAQEFQKAVVTLLAAHLPAAAFALTRLIYEATVRGIWLQHCATEGDLNRFEKDDVPKIEPLLAAIERVEGFDVGILRGVKAGAWGVMNSYTHTGFSQVARRFSQDFVEANYSDDEKIEVLNFALAFGCVAAIAACESVGHRDRAATILEKVTATGFGK